MHCFVNTAVYKYNKQFASISVGRKCRPYSGKGNESTITSILVIAYLLNDANKILEMDAFESGIECLSLVIALNSANADNIRLFTLEANEKQRDDVKMVHLNIYYRNNIRKRSRKNAVGLGQRSIGAASLPLQPHMRYLFINYS